MNKLQLQIASWVAIIFCFAIPLSCAAAAPDVVMTNLYDAFGSEKANLKPDFGFSTIVAYKGKTILFDSGTDARIFETNLKVLKIDLKKIDVVIVSHGHYDHIGGLDTY